jgi:uncharacterized protein YhdP
LAARLRWLARVLAGLVIAAWSLLLVAWLTLHWGILPHIDEWRPQIAARAGRALGVPVQIGNIAVRSSGWMPTLELRDVVLQDRQGRPALSCRASWRRCLRARCSRSTCASSSC